MNSCHKKKAVLRSCMILLESVEVSINAFSTDLVGTTETNFTRISEVSFESSPGTSVVVEGFPVCPRHARKVLA